MGIFTISKRTRHQWRQAKVLIVAMAISVLVHLAIAVNPSLGLGQITLGEPPSPAEPITYTDIAAIDDSPSAIEQPSATTHPIAKIADDLAPAPANTSDAGNSETAPATDSNALATDSAPPADNEAVPVATSAENMVPPTDSPSSSNSRQAEATSIQRSFPARLTLSYDLFKGDEGVKLGRASHRWLTEGGNYQLDSEAEATGMLALLNLGIYSQQSRGKLGPQGITPEHYREMRGENRRHHYIAEFDYSNYTLQLGQADSLKNVEFSIGAQDQLSFIYQLALKAPLPASITLPVATGRKYALYTIDNLGEKKLRTPLGELNTLHLSRQKRQPKDESIDIWLAIDFNYVPVKIVMTDRKGDTYSQVIRSMN